MFTRGLLPYFASLALSAGVSGCDREPSAESETDAGSAEVDPQEKPETPPQPETVTYYQDADGDGFGNEYIFRDRAYKPTGFVERAGDCNDNDPLIYKGAEERCNEIDDDCDGLTDEGLDKVLSCVDEDRDGFGSPNDCRFECSLPYGHIDNALDCKDDDTSVNIAAAEICNGRDDNCNHLIDEDIPVVTEGNVSISDEQTDVVLLDEECGHYSSIWDFKAVWTGNHYGILWSKGNENGGPSLYLTLVNARGERLTRNVLIAEHALYNNDIVWNGEMFAVVWLESSMFFSRFDFYGMPVGDNVLMPYGFHNPSLVTTGTGYGLAWNGWGPGPVNFRLLKADGTPDEEITVLSESDECHKPELAWTGNGFSAAWQCFERDQNRKALYYARLSPSGEMLGEAVRISTLEDMHTIYNYPMISAGGNVFLSWVDDSKLFLAQFDDNGRRAHEDRILACLRTSFEAPSLVLSDAGLGVYVKEHPDFKFSYVRMDKAVDRREFLQSSASSLNLFWRGDRFTVIDEYENCSTSLKLRDIFIERD